MGNGNQDILRHELTEQLKEKLPVLRARARISQENVARKIGISRQTYSMIESGKKEMSWTVFMALIALFQSDSRTNMMLENIPNFKDLQQILN